MLQFKLTTGHLWLIQTSYRAPVIYCFRNSLSLKA